MKTKLVPISEPNVLSQAADILQNGGVVAFPTDTVYGLASMAFDEDSIQRLYIIKGRKHTKAIAVLISDISELEKVVLKPSNTALDLAKQFWPGPLTMVLPQHPDVPSLLSPTRTIGVRIPDHPVALALLKLTGPLGVTSANLAGKETTVEAEEVREQLEGRVHMILDGGKTPGGIPSTVIDCTTEDFEVLREGPISRAELKAFTTKRIFENPK